jgi:hypothetical protein
MKPETSPVTNNRQIIKVESSYSTNLTPDPPENLTLSTLCNVDKAYFLAFCLFFLTTPEKHL